MPPGAVAEAELGEKRMHWFYSQFHSQFQSKIPQNVALSSLNNDSETRQMEQNLSTNGRVPTRGFTEPGIFPSILVLAEATAATPMWKGTLYTSSISW